MPSWAAPNPGKLSFGSVGIGSTTHLAGEMLAMMGGIDMVHIPYKGGRGFSTTCWAGAFPWRSSASPA